MSLSDCILCIFFDFLVFDLFYFWYFVKLNFLAIKFWMSFDLLDIWPDQLIQFVDLHLKQATQFGRSNPEGKILRSYVSMFFLVSWITRLEWQKFIFQFLRILENQFFIFGVHKSPRLCTNFHNQSWIIIINHDFMRFKLFYLFSNNSDQPTWTNLLLIQNFNFEIRAFCYYIINYRIGS